MTDSSRPEGNGRKRSEFYQSVDRLHEALEDLATVAGRRISDQASTVIDDMTHRIREEILQDGEAPADAPRQRRRRRYRHHRSDFNGDTTWPGTRGRLVRDTRHRMLGGVCAGIARYLQVERWLVRVIAITGLLFMWQIVVPAYVIALFLMPKDFEAAAKSDDKKASGPPEPPSKRSPAERLRRARSRFDQLELRLRRMESHVTSNRYELQREFDRIAD